MPWLDEKVFPAVKKDLSTVVIIVLAFVVVFLFKRGDTKDEEIKELLKDRAGREQEINKMLIGVVEGQTEQIKANERLLYGKSRYYSGIDSNSAKFYQ